MFEALSFRLFNLAGCPACKTNWVHFRIIDEAYEDGTRNAAHPPLTTSGTQYDGDFWGLYMTIEQMDGRFLDEHGLPDGNLYKMEDGTGDSRTTRGRRSRPTAPTSTSSSGATASARRRGGGRTSTSTPTTAITPSTRPSMTATSPARTGSSITTPTPTNGGNCPWDKDLTWTTYYGSNDPSDPFSRARSAQHQQYRHREQEPPARGHRPALQHRSDEPADRRIRRVINDPAGGPSIVDADRRMWDYHWVMWDRGLPQVPRSGGQLQGGPGTCSTSPPRVRAMPRTFEGMVQVMKDYVVDAWDAI